MSVVQVPLPSQNIIPVDEGLELLRSKYLTGLIYTTDGEIRQEFIAILLTLGVKFINPWYGVLTVFIPKSLLHYRKTGILPFIQKTVTELLGVPEVIVFENIRRDDEIIAVLNNKRSFGEIDHTKIREIGWEIRRKISASTEIPVTVGIGGYYHSISGFSISYMESSAAAHIAHECGEGVLCYTPAIWNARFTFFWPEKEKRLLISHLTSRNASKAIEMVEQLFAKMQQQNLTDANINLVAQDLLFSLAKSLQETGHSLERILEEDVLSLDYLSRFYIPEELCVFFRHLLSVVSNYLESLSHSYGKKTVQDIKNYIHNHYDSEINLSQLSRRYYINPCYLSYLFKNETGEKFMDYLTRVRLEKAKELLLETTLPSGQIAKMVGYNSSRYFGDLFVKYTGMTPTRYRCNITQPKQTGKEN